MKDLEKIYLAGVKEGMKPGLKLLRKLRDHFKKHNFLHLKDFQKMLK